MSALFGVPISDIILGAFSGQLQSVTLHKITSSLDIYGAPERFETNVSGEGVRLQWKTETAVARGYPKDAAKILVLQDGIDAPNKDDEITILGERYRIIDVMKDPVDATWTLAAIRLPNAPTLMPLSGQPAATYQQVREMDAGFGWVDYSDLTSGTETPLLAGVRTQISRELSASGANNKLAGHWFGHNFWGGIVGDRKIVGVSVDDVVTMSFALRVRPGLIGGILSLEIDIGGTVGAVVTKAVPITGEVGEIERLRIDATIPMQSTFIANGGRVYLTSTVPMTLVEFSPEFYPIGFTP